MMEDDIDDRETEEIMKEAINLYQSVIPLLDEKPTESIMSVMTSILSTIMCESCASIDEAVMFSNLVSAGMLDEYSRVSRMKKLQ